MELHTIQLVHSKSSRSFAVANDGINSLSWSLLNEYSINDMCGFGMIAKLHRLDSRLRKGLQ